MQTMETIFQRRSIRVYDKDKKLTKGQIETLLSAAMMAPTGRNIQEWEFLVIENPDTIKSIMTVHPHATCLETAPCVLVVCANMHVDMASNFWVGDCGAATQNILLAAKDMGLGSLWMGVQCAPERAVGLKKLFNLPSHIEPFSLIAVGYPAEDVPGENRFDFKKVHFEKWS